DDALSSMNVIWPKSNLAVVSETVAGDEGTLVVRATVAGDVCTGRVNFVRERGEWKIFSESWDVGTPPTPAETMRHSAAIRRLMERGYAHPKAAYFDIA